ncbi:reverse transcriptase, partial [Tanacetum coccineum]
MYEDPMVELKNPRQTTAVQVYQDLFEALMNKVELTESYAISLFIGGLMDEIGMVVRMFKPTKLTDVYCLAKMQEQTIAVSKSRHAPLLSTPKTSIVNTNVNRNGSNWGKTGTPAQNSTNVLNTPFKRLTQQELEEKKAKHLCFYCDQKYMPGHKCSGQVFSLEVMGIDVEEDGDLMLTEEIDEQPLISLNALSGVNTYRTMRVKGCVGRNTLHVLVDSGSTHNFLDLHTAKKLGWKLRKVCPLDVSVANGNVMVSMYECKDFTWMFQRIPYTAVVMILPLKQESGDKGNVGTGAELAHMNLCIYLAAIMKLEANNHVLEPISELLAEFESVFEVPKELPPKRSHDHTIPLIPNTPPINIRPYRHPPNQKDAVELMVKELLDSGVIRNSQSPFSSPIVMVKKKDGT